MSKKNANLNEVIQEVERLATAWRHDGLRDGAIAADVVVEALKQKFMRGALAETAAATETDPNHVCDSPDCKGHKEEL